MFVWDMSQGPGKQFNTHVQCSMDILIQVLGTWTASDLSCTASLSSTVSTYVL